MPRQDKGSSDHMTIQRYPFDTDGLNKGDTIAPEIIEYAYGISRAQPNYRWALLRARKFVVSAFKVRGVVVTVVIRGDSLKICTDDEQYMPNIRTIATGQRKMRRGHGRMVGADRSKMSPETLAKHDRAVEVNGRKLAAMRAVTMPELPAVSERSTPGHKRSSEDKP